MALTATPSSLTFTSIAHGTSSSLAVRLTPDLTADSVFGVKITGPDAALFTTDENLDDPQPGAWNYLQGSQIVGGYGAGSPTFNVTYSPVVAGSHSAVLEIYYNGVGMPAVLTIDLAGTAS